VRQLDKYARVGVGALSTISAYTRRLGVIPDSYGSVLGSAVERLTGSKPSLKARDAMLCSLRAALWDAASASFRAARDARSWVYTNDPEDLLFKAEDDRCAQAIFERARSAKMSADTASSQREHATRRSRRGRVPRALSTDFHWNLADEYVLALDDRPKRGSASIFARNAGRRRRLRMRLTALI
jgi:hypothetical protein